MSKAGRSIHLDSGVSYAEHKPTRHTYRIYERKGAYVMPVWIEKSLFRARASTSASPAAQPLQEGDLEQDEEADSRPLRTPVNPPRAMVEAHEVCSRGRRSPRQLQTKGTRCPAAKPKPQSSKYM